MTKATIKKIAKAASVDIDLIKITKSGGTYRFEHADFSAEQKRRSLEYEGPGQLPEIEKAIKKYNKAVKKLIKALKCEHWGYMTGYGAWCYELGKMDVGRKLAFYNID